MSILLTKEPGTHINPMALLAICCAQRFKEIGVVYALDGVLTRKVGFPTIGAMLSEVPDESAALMYFDNPKAKYDEENFSPLIVGPDVAFAFCGEMLALMKSHEHLSNNRVFNDQTMKKVYAVSPDVFETSPFKWMIMKIARSFVGGAILKSDGSFHYYSPTLFTEKEGYSYMDSEIAEAASDTTTYVTKPDLEGCLTL